MPRPTPALWWQDAGYLFPSPTGGVWTNTNFRARSRWMDATREAGLEGTTIHDLRHTAASLLIAAGADVKAVQVVLRHSTATMTMDLYGHVFSEATWQAMERLPAIPLMEAPRAIRPAPQGRVRNRRCANDGSREGGMYLRVM